MARSHRNKGNRRKPAQAKFPVLLGHGESVGRSDLVPPLPDEPYWDRHERRYQTAMEHEPQVREWCDAHGWKLEILDGRWVFTWQHFIVSWWPHSADLLLQNRVRIHAHDAFQVIGILAERFQP